MIDQPDPGDDASTPPRPRRPRGGAVGLAGIAAVIAIIALGLAAWNTWRLQRTLEAASAASRQEAAALADLRSQLAASNQRSQAGNQRTATLAQGLDDLRAGQRGLESRASNLEDAVSNLSGQQQSGQDMLLLDDAEMLLRTARQRYELFHDSTGALKAYSQALEVLGQVQNPAYAPVRASAAAERSDLAAAAPPARQASLDTLSRLRSEITSWPLAAPAPASATSSSPGFWSRVAHSFGGIVRVTRDNGSVTPPTDTGFARQALALDLAQAQEALLAFDEASYRAALQRADAALAAQFDANDAGVKRARAEIADMLAWHGSGAAPRLGAALAQLQRLRARQAPLGAPASATSTGVDRP
ncbi:MAG TPA: uroporphyrinogen-III C-methyltransferase [Rhodanobacteraceae bacterium]|jgi:uroporphyrin-3 C-methyltransferase|nr:uroporphyrinogen-III C-methyltransferase [Rhodanobacteraceae bacterium]